MSDESMGPITSCQSSSELREGAHARPASATRAHRALERLAGESDAIRSVRDSLPRIARAKGSVLIQGSSGTGKELAARIVHELSCRAGGPFIAVDCGAMAEGVLESELFGHARGAFTSAAADRRGLFEAAAGGTIFLDEIANTSRDFQARLLRVLQEREVRPVGANTSRPVDVRVIAATNRDLEGDASTGRFREDLLYRLDVLGLRMPSLKERRDDIMVLARHVLLELEEQTGDLPRIAPEAVATLLAHDWPGNVRELRNVLERAAAFAVRGVIELEHLPERVRNVSTPPADRPPLVSFLDDCERAFLTERLMANAWNRTRTAAEIGITRRGLFNKILRHQITPPPRRRMLATG